MAGIKNITVKDLMVEKPFKIDVEEPLSRAWKLFYTHGIRHLPVVDKDNALKGIITLRDLYRISSPKKNLQGETFYNKEDLDRYILKHVMTKKVFTLPPEAPIGRVIDIMVKRKYGCVPVIDSGQKLLGIVTHIDILRKVAGYFS